VAIGAAAPRAPAAGRAAIGAASPADRAGDLPVPAAALGAASADRAATAAGHQVRAVVRPGPASVQAVVRPGPASVPVGAVRVGVGAGPVARATARAPEGGPATAAVAASDRPAGVVRPQTPVLATVTRAHARPAGPTGLGAARQDRGPRGPGRRQVPAVTAADRPPNVATSAALPPGRQEAAAAVAGTSRPRQGNRKLRPAPPGARRPKAARAGHRPRRNRRLLRPSPSRHRRRSPTRNDPPAGRPVKMAGRSQAGS
jgi:hypothetical protein